MAHVLLMAWGNEDEMLADMECIHWGEHSSAGLGDRRANFEKNYGIPGWAQMSWACVAGGYLDRRPRGGLVGSGKD